MRHVTAKAAKVLFLTTLTAAALALSAAAAEESVGVGAVTGSSVRMRAEASTSSEILVTMDKGSVVAFLSETPEDDWYHVAFAGNEGYVHADYVIRDKDNVFTTYGRANCGGVRIRTACKEQLRGLLLKGKLFGVFLSGDLLLLLERRLGCFGLCLPGGRRFRLRRLARCTRGKAECQQQRKSKGFSYSHDRSSS